MIQIKITEDGWRGKWQNIAMGAVCDAASLPQPIRALKQVHGNRVINDGDWQNGHQEGDGLVSDCAGTCLVVRTADCVPVHFTDGHRIAVVHAGWRGTKAGILEQAETYFEPRQTHAVIGPSISGVNYQVDSDLYGDWLAREPELSDFLQDKGCGSKRWFDLKGFIANKLTTANFASVSIIPICTFDSKLPSYRREHDNAGRLQNFIHRTP